ncbi:hypothetical protein B0H19DRAFT_1182836 [Mycena capillaripes]|nr:hypothetical protein B0H19DRAFT_1182836 [Mycena capillaripes]
MPQSRHYSILPPTHIPSVRVCPAFFVFSSRSVYLTFLLPFLGCNSSSSRASFLILSLWLSVFVLHHLRTSVCSATARQRRKSGV